MKMSKLMILPTLVAGLLLAHGATADDSHLIAELKNSRISLLDGIKQAEKGKAVVISAKFEMDDNNQLSLSIYTAPAGLDVPAESNPLTELSGSPAVAPFAPSAEVFADKEHIARASTHLAIMQLSRFTLSQIVELALNEQRGTPYSVANPMIRDHQPIADVYIVDKSGKSVRVAVNVQTGDADIQ